MGRRGKKAHKRPTAQGPTPTNDPTSADASAATPTEAAPETSTFAMRDQYHHYIPRFILRNFALDEHLVHAKERHDIYQYTLADKVLRIADIDRSYGVVNMYSDIQNLADLNFVEIKMSKLEADAADIIRKSFMDFGKREVTITSPELTVLRKFLWIMSFRNRARRQQYKDERFDASGKKIQQAFMKAKGRSSLNDVWLENVKGLLLDDGSPLNYFKPIDEILTDYSRLAGPMELIDYKGHIQTTFLCIWEAPEPYEFILTDNGFNIFEGDAGRAFAGSAYHYFYPISPRRILVAARISFKEHELLGVKHREYARKTLGTDPSRSWLSRGEINVPPRPKYYGKPDGVGLFQDGNLSNLDHGLIDR